MCELTNLADRNTARRRHRRAAQLLIGATLLVVSTATILSGAGRNDKITGSVRDAETGEPIDGAAVIAIGPDRRPSVSISRSDGSFSVEAARGASVTLRAAKNGYAGGLYGQRYSRFELGRQDIGVMHSVIGGNAVILPLWKDRTVKVAPVAPATPTPGRTSVASIFRCEVENGIARPAWLRTVQLRDNFYRFEGLTADTYIAIQHELSEPLGREPSNPIAIGTRVFQAAIDGQYNLVPHEATTPSKQSRNRLKGVVADVPSSGILRMFGQGRQQWFEPAPSLSARVDTAGNFDMPLDVPDLYGVEFAGQQSAPIRLTDLDLGTDRTQRQAIAFPRGFAFSGRVVGNPALRAVEGRHLGIAAVGRGATLRQTTLVTKDGRFLFSNVSPGTYRINIGGSPHVAVVGLTIASARVPGSIVTLGGPTPDTLVHVSAQGTSRVAGTLTALGSAATIYAFPAERSSWRTLPASTTFASLVAKQGGSFSLDLSPGLYIVVAVSEPLGASWNDEINLRALAAIAGDPVVVPDGKTINLHLEARQLSVGTKTLVCGGLESSPRTQAPAVRR